jgi:hypothetical protein
MAERREKAKIAAPVDRRSERFVNMVAGFCVPLLAWPGGTKEDYASALARMGMRKRAESRPTPPDPLTPSLASAMRMAA